MNDKSKKKQVSDKKLISQSPFSLKRDNTSTRNSSEAVEEGEEVKIKNK